ncbi:M56 family metallopeptidase [Aeoliella sp. SH292]|uniref:M56 family metallopeptidase n=1 Tax=Aeoliella sp. SH292 TaxID=3454464 RepID=UPI003F9BED79
MNPLNWIGPETTTALSLTLLHSLWQVGLAVGVLWCVERIWRKIPIERNYTLHAGMLLLTLALLPMTFYWVQTTRQVAIAPVARAESLTQFTPPPSAVVSAEFDLPPATQSPTEPASEVIPTVAPASEYGDADPASNWWPFAAMWVAACYVLGVLVMLLRLMLAIRRTERIRRRATHIEPGPLASTFARLARELGVSLGCVLATSRDVLVPTVVGVVKPTILLPASALTGLSANELEMILLHELAHVRRHDQWVNLVQRLAEVVLFFNPALWYLSRRIATLREYCCDELTCRQLSPGDTAAHVEYAATLLHVVELASPASPVLAELSSLAATGRGPSELRRRVARLFGEPLAEPVRLSRPQGVLLIAMALVLVGAPFAQSKSEGESDTPTSEVATIDANERVAEARRRTFGLQKTPKITIHQRMWNGTIPTMSNVSGDPADLLWRARGQDVDGAMREATLTDLILAWDGPKLLIENATRSSGEHPWIQSRFWNGDTGWLGEGAPTERRYYRYGEIGKLMEHIAPYSALYWVAAGGRLPWGGPEVVLEENDTAPAETHYQQVGTENIDGVECEIFIGPERMETIWIGKEEGLVKALTRNYVFTGLANYYSDGVKEIAGRTFQDGAEYSDWRRKQSPEMEKKLAAHWKAAAWAQSEPGNLTVFSDYREIVPGVEWPMRCEHLVSHPTDREKGTRRFYRSETLVQKMETDFAIDELAATAIPPLGKEVTDRRAEPEVLYQWHPDLIESEIELKRLHLQIIRDSVKADQQKIDETPIDSVDDAMTILLEGPNVDPCKVWVRAIKYLVEHKETAFLVVLRAFDAETRDHPLSKLAFTLRAMDDPRAVPALIRALPRTLVPARSDYGLILEGDNAELLRFVQQNDLGSDAGDLFSYGRAFREVVGTLHKLTDKDFGDMELNAVHLGEAPTQRNAARRQLQTAAERWAAWWDAEGHQLVSDPAYAKANLPELELEEVGGAGPSTLPVGEQLRLRNTLSGASISSIHETNDRCFYDLDTGRQSGWPSHLPQFGKIGLDSPELLAWAREEGFDLVGVSHTPEGEDKPLYCLQPIDVKAWKISEQEHRQLQESITGKSPYPLAKPVELLMPRRVIPKPHDRNFSGDAFLFLTREGTAGVLRATEQVTETNIQARYSMEDLFDGDGFHRGVAFSLQEIAPPSTVDREDGVIPSTPTDAVGPMSPPEADDPSAEPLDTDKTGELDPKDDAPQPDQARSGVPIQCLDADQKPVAGAEVYVFQHEGGDNGKYRQFGPFTTDVDGKALWTAAISNPTTEDQRYDRFYYARVPGKLVGLSQTAIWPGPVAVNPEDGVIVFLLPSRSVKGQVIVPDGFNPTGVTVRVNSFATSPESRTPPFPQNLRLAGIESAIASIFETQVASDGTFHLEDVFRDASLSLSGTAKGLGESQWHTLEGRLEDITLEFHRQGKLTGTVRTSEGQPLPNAKVSAQIHPVAGQRVGQRTTFLTETDDQGHYELHGLPEWNLALRVTDPDKRLVLSPSAPFSIASDTEMTLNVTMEKPVEVHVRVVDPQGEPIVGASLSAITADSNHTEVSGAISDSKGRVVMRIPSGHFEIYFSGLPYGFEDPEPRLLHELEIDSGQQTIKDLEFVVPWEKETDNEPQTKD